MPIGYLFLDIVNSTERWERAPGAMRAAVERLHAIIDAKVAAETGVIHDRAGDGVFAIFASGNPVQCALDIQLAMQDEDWSAVGGLEVRLGVHVGADQDGGDQPSVNRAARIAASGWGGQIVVSSEAIAAFAPPPSSACVELGVCRFKGIDEPLSLSSLVHPQLAKTVFPPLRTLAVQGLNIPRSDDPLFGRERETEEILDRLAQSRLLTIVGPGGAGKTRLAARIALALAEDRSVVFVSLDAVATNAELVSAIAGALHFPFHGPDQREAQLIGYLRDRRMLMVLDNGDAVAGHAGFVGELTAACARLTVLATSREPLRTGDETLYRLGGLAFALPSEDVFASPAYQLFAFEARAKGVERPFTGQARQFQEICELVDGSPLALRLVARWSRLLSLEEMLAQLRAGSGFVSAAASDAQLSLKGVFEGSWRLLDAGQQTALARLSVFAGPFDWSAAKQVAGVDLGTYAALADKSLLDESAERSFSIHPLIRGFAREKLALAGEDEAMVLQRHARHYLDLVSVRLVGCSPNEQGEALDHLYEAFANIRAAWRHANMIGDMGVRQAVIPLHRFFTLRSMIREGVALFSLEPGDASIRSLMKSVLAASLVQHGDFAAGEAAAKEVFARRGEPVARGFARDALGGAAHARGDYKAARRHYERALSLWSHTGSELNGSFTAIALALLHFSHGEERQAARWAKQAFRFSRRSGNTLGMLLAQMLAGDLAVRDDRLDAAKLNYEKALLLEAAGRTPHVRASVLRRLGSLHLRLGDAEAALSHHSEALELATEVGEQRTRAHTLVEMGEDLRGLGLFGEARTRLLEGVRLALKLGVEPLVTQGLLTLAQLELQQGMTRHAERLAGVLAGRALGELQTGYARLVEDLGANSTLCAPASGIDDILDDIADAAEMGSVE